MAGPQRRQPGLSTWIRVRSSPRLSVLRIEDHGDYGRLSATRRHPVRSRVGRRPCFSVTLNRRWRVQTPPVTPARSPGAFTRPIPCVIASSYPAWMRASTDEREKSEALDSSAGRLEVTTLKWLIFRRARSQIRGVAPDVAVLWKAFIDLR